MGSGGRQHTWVGGACRAGGGRETQRTDVQHRGMCGSLTSARSGGEEPVLSASPAQPLALGRPQCESRDGSHRQAPLLPLPCLPAKVSSSSYRLPRMPGSQSTGPAD